MSKSTVTFRLEILRVLGHYNLSSPIRVFRVAARAIRIRGGE